MPRYVALFRGINVGRAKRIAMADLRALLGKLGYADVATLLNSGNAVFTANAEPAATHARRIREAVHTQLGVDAFVIVKSDKEVAGIVACVVGFTGRLTWDASKPDGEPRKLLDVSKLTALGWNARTRLTEGIAQAYASFLAEKAAGVLRA